VTQPQPPQPVDRGALAYALFAFGFINLAVVLYFAGIGGKPVHTVLLACGALCAVPAWIRLRRS